MFHGPSHVRHLIPIQVCAEGSKMNSLFQTTIPCFRVEQGIGCKLLIHLANSSKTTVGGWNRAKIAKIPCSQGLRGSRPAHDDTPYHPAPMSRIASSRSNR